MEILIVLFSLSALGALVGMVKYGGWNFSMQSANVVFIYIFLLSLAVVIWSWIAMKEMAQEEAEQEAAFLTPEPEILPAEFIEKAVIKKKKAVSRARKR